MGYEAQNGPSYFYDLTKISENVVYAMFKEVIEKMKLILLLDFLQFYE